jgi:hypothetical protein
MMMKKHILPLALAACLLLSLTSVTVLAVPDVTTNVGDDDGVVTTVATTPSTTPTTAPVTTATPATTAPVTTARPTTTAPAVTTAPTTTPMDMEDEGGSVLGIILAVLIAAAIVVLMILLLPKMRRGRDGR